MSSDVSLLLLGWLLGVASSLITSLFMWWLEGRRQIRNEIARQRREDIKTARNWAVNGKKDVLKGLDLRGANLSGIDLSNADLEDADLSNAQMWNTHLREAKLIRTKFRGTTINGAEFQGANLHSADFEGARIRNTSFAEAKLRRTRFLKLRALEDCIWTQAQIDETTLLSQEDRAAIMNVTG
jgi:uncharacterized protein YjbI with pentapeptide repeats